MDYEKAYKEALERAKKLLLGNEHSNTIRSYFEHIFPELRESEDESIRKWIIEKLQGYADSGIPFPDEIQMADKAIAYLEKQEQKPAWSEEDEHRRKDAIYFLESAMRHYADTSEIEKTIAWLKSLRPSWKPSEEQLNALNFAITYFMHETNYKNPTELRDLYNDLLKLKDLCQPTN